MRKYLIPAVVLLMVLWLTAAGSPPSPLIASPPESPLFTPLAATQRTPSAGPEVIRARFVAVDMALLTPTAETLSVNPFAGLEWTAVRDNIERHPLYPNSFSWQGHLEGVPLSQATFTVHEGIVVGKIAMPGGVYELRHNAGATEIIHLNQTAFTDHGQALIGVEPGNVRAPQAPQALADDGSTIDVMVLYTPQARVGAGGTSAIEATIQLAVSETNQAYANSGVNQRMFLVHTAEVTYNETTDGGTDLGRLRDPGDGFMDEIHGWRNTYHADFVALIVEDMIYQSVAVCGLGYRPNALNDASFESSAFSVTARGCATGNYTFGHEVGHNMGLNHDWYADGDLPPVNQAHGYAHPSPNSNERWRTVMAYNNLCAANGGSCVRLLYFSNPNQTYTGDPMGVAAGTADDCLAGSMSPDPRSCDADNRSVLNDNALNNAQYRRSAATWTGTADTNWHNPANWVMQDGAYNGLSPVNRVPRTIDDAIVPASPTGGRFPVLGTVASVRNLHIQPNAVLYLSGNGSLDISQELRNEGQIINLADLEVRAYLPLIVRESTPPAPADCLTAEEAQLGQLINNYRANNGLPAVPFSASLTKVAQLHVRDLHNHNPNSGTDPETGEACNLHSWSANGNWSAVCYVGSHEYASGMWDKPREITDNVYTGSGYEIAYGSFGINATAAGSLAAWQSSAGHNAVILNTGTWANFPTAAGWPGMGMGIYEGYAVVWFGDAASDPNGTISQCQ